jgi:hypothetical protein
MKHTGGCHCGKVRYEVEMEIGKVLACNCSICTKRGSLLAFTPATSFKLLSGENELTDYLFNKHVIHHLFCKTCGILSFAKAVGPNGVDTRAINVRCLDNVDVEKLDVMNYDGRSK